MRADEIAVALRERTGLEAIDLGFAMARAWWRPVWGSWCALVLPLGLVLVVALRDQPWWAIGLLWWLRPAFGRLPLFVLSRRLFGDEVGVRETLAALPELARSGLGVSLFAQRLSPARTFLQPVVQLEGLRGAARRERSAVLARQDVGAAMGLLTVGAHMNGAILIGLPGLIGLLIPDELGWRLSSLVDPALLDTFGLAGAVAYLIGISVVEPLLVAGGFGLYVNRRVYLEGWDIELALRRLADRRDAAADGPGPTRRGATIRAAGLALAALLGTLAAPLPSTADAPACDERDPTSARACIEQVLSADDFARVEEQMQWVMREFEEPDVELGPISGLSEWLAGAFQALGWAALIGVALALVVAVARRVEAPARAAPAHPTRPTELFGLALDPESLPDDLVGAARRAFEQGRAVVAMSLLYRGALVRLIDHHGLAIPESATEYECLGLVAGADARGRPLPARAFAELTEAWIGTRYAALPPERGSFETLCEAFAETFVVARAGEVAETGIVPEEGR